MTSYNLLQKALSPVGLPTRPVVRSADRQSVLVPAVLVEIVLLTLPILYRAELFPAVPLIYSACFSVTVLYITAMCSWLKLTGSLFDSYTTFLTAVMLFNGSRATLEVVQLNPDSILGLARSPEIILQTLYTVMLGIWSMHLGAVIGARSSKQRFRAAHRHCACDDHRLRFVGWMAIAVAIIPSFMLLRDAVSAVLAYGYHVALFQQEASTSVDAIPRVLSMLLVPGTIMVAAAGRVKSLQLGITAVLVASYAVTQLFLGSRALAISATVPYLWVWHRCVRRIPTIPAITAGLMAVAVLLPVVGAGRLLLGEDRLSPAALMQTFYSIENPSVAVVSEMGYSANTIASTIELVPDQRPYDYGASYGYALLTLVPNFIWDIHPSIAHGTPTTWLIRTINPWVADQGGSVGFSLIAEAYLNFGYLGVLAIPAILGFGFARLTSWAQPGDLARMACAATVLAFSVKYARSDATEIVRGVVWYAAIPYCVVAALIRRRSFQSADVSLRKSSRRAVPSCTS